LDRCEDLAGPNPSHERAVTQAIDSLTTSEKRKLAVLLRSKGAT